MQAKEEGCAIGGRHHDRAARRVLFCVSFFVVNRFLVSVSGMQIIDG